MPAVVLSRLNREIDSISEKLAKPSEFKERLEGLLIRYGDLTYKPGKEVSQSRDLSSSHRTVRIVMQHLQVRFAKLAATQPELIQEASQALWDSEITEMRTLASVLIGSLPPEFTSVTYRQLALWAAPELESVQLRGLFEAGTKNLRGADPARWINQIRQWLSGSEPSFQRLGLLALTELAHDDSFENLPAIFNATADILAMPLKDLSNEIRRLVSALGARSPIETSYILRQAITNSHSPQIVRIVRRILPELPSEQQETLRKALSTAQSDDQSPSGLETELGKLEYQD